jgi:hypothetical protein
VTQAVSMGHVFLALLLTGCDFSGRSAFAVVNGEVLSNYRYAQYAGYWCEFGVLKRAGGSRPILDANSKVITCESVMLTHKEYCLARKAVGARECR